MDIHASRKAVQELNALYAEMNGYKIEPPKEKLKTDRNMFNIPKSEQDAARERIKAKTAAKRAKMSEGVRDEDPEKGTAERKARLEIKRGMKMDDHPQYNKKKTEQYESNPNKIEDPRQAQEGYKTLPKEKMARQADKAYGKEVRAAAAGDEKETNKQMQRRIAMKDPAGRKAALKREELELSGKFTAEEIEKILEIMGE